MRRRALLAAVTTAALSAKASAQPSSMRRIAYATTPRYPDAGGRIYRFATSIEAEAMQRWINKSGIEDRPTPESWNGAQLTCG